jgi:hypothetical protein
MEAAEMKKLIAIPTCDEKGILNGMEVIDRVYVPDEVIIGDKTIKITGRKISEISGVPGIIFDVSEVEGFANEEVPKLSLPATESRIVRAGQFLRDKVSQIIL